MLTGTTIVGASWQLLHIPILTLLAGLAIGAWWFVFLVAYPKVSLLLYSTPDDSLYNGSSWSWRDCIQLTKKKMTAMWEGGFSISCHISRLMWPRSVERLDAITKGLKSSRAFCVLSKPNRFGYNMLVYPLTLAKCESESGPETNFLTCFLPSNDAV